MTTWPVLPAKRHETRNGYRCPPLVRGATIAVRREALISSGDTTTHGRVLRISLPRVGSSATRNTSPRRGGKRATIPTRCRRRSSGLLGQAGGRHPVRAACALLRPTRLVVPGGRR